MTAIELIEETVKYYEEDPARRAINVHGGCSYRTPDGRMCAVGRCLLPEFAMQADHLVDGSPWGTGAIELSDSVGGDLDSILKEEYRGLSLTFWVDLQILHDSDTCWYNTTEAETLRYENVQRLKEKYK